MRCLVTGGTGLVGSNLALELAASGHDVVITGNEAEQQLPGFTGKCLNPGFLGIDWDAIGEVDAVFHQAALNNTRNMDRAEMFRANVESSAALFKYVVERGCRRIVYASSTAVYGRNAAPFREEGPFDLNTPYAESKKALEEYATSFAAAHPGVVIVGLRYCNVYGPRENHKGTRATMIYQLARQMMSGNPRLFEFGEQKRDYIYVKDVVRANLLASEAGASCIVNCASGRATTFNRLVEILNSELGLDRKPEYFPNPFGANYQSDTRCDTAEAAERIGFEAAFGIEEGIRDYVESGWLTR
jgi:ADP-L-glycero-D-manno-heptose 6-epimerase